MRTALDAALDTNENAADGSGIASETFSGVTESGPVTDPLPAGTVPHPAEALRAQHQDEGSFRIVITRLVPA